MEIKNVGQLRKIIENLPDDFEIEMRIRRKLTDEELKNCRYPYPYLKELGLDTSDGSMFFEWSESDPDNMVLTSLDADTNYDYCRTTYTLQDILDKLPCFIGNQVLTIQKLADSYTCLYMEPYSRSIIKITESKELIDAAYEMLCWCIENGYVKVGKEE